MLRCRAVVEDGGLCLDIVLENRTDTALWVASALPRSAGSGLRMDETLAYVRPQAGGVVVTRHLLPIPDGVLVEKPEMPTWARVDPGSDYVAQLRTAWPMLERDPYAPKRARELGTPQTIICEIGYLGAEGEDPPSSPGLIWGRQSLARAIVSIASE